MEGQEGYRVMTVEGRTERCCVYQKKVSVRFKLPKSANILPDCVSPATSCGGPVLLDRTDLTENERPVLLTMT